MFDARDGRQTSYAEHLAFERTAEVKHEYVNGRVSAMAGGTPEQSRLAARLTALLGGAREGRRCEVSIRSASRSRSTTSIASLFRANR